jgi:hypothetical protein
MAKPKATTKENSLGDRTPVVAATLAGVIYQSRLFNRQAKLNIPEQEIITDVVNLWHTVKDLLERPRK